MSEYADHLSSVNRALVRGIPEIRCVLTCQPRLFHLVLVALFAAATTLVSLSSRAGYDSNGYDSNGYDSNGYGSNGLDSSGYDSNAYKPNGYDNSGYDSKGFPYGGNPNLNAVLRSLLWGNPTVHDAFISLPFTAYNLTNNGVGLSTTDPVQGPLRTRQMALYQVWRDPHSVNLLAYLWKIVHGFHDDLTFDSCAASGTGSCPVTFRGHLGVCDRGATNIPRGWASDLPLVDDVKCQFWSSAHFLALQNNFGYHSMLGMNGPTSRADFVSSTVTNGSDDWFGRIGNQGTWQSDVVPTIPYRKDSKEPVASVTTQCPPGTSGPANCGRVTGPVGVCTPGDQMIMRVKPGSNPSSTPLMLFVNQGAHAHNYPFASGGMCAGLPPGTPCPDADFLSASVAAGAAAPSVSFRCPMSGTIGTDWGKFNRDDPANVAPEFEMLVVDAAHPQGVTAVTPSGRPGFPANETDIFKRTNREAYFAGNVWGAVNRGAELAQCEIRTGPTAALCAPPTCNGICSPEPPTRSCDPAYAACCSACEPTSQIHYSQPNAPNFLSSIGGYIDPSPTHGNNEAYSLVHNNTGETILITSVQLSANVWVANAVAMWTGVEKLNNFVVTAGSGPILALVPNKNDLRRVVPLPATAPQCGTNDRTPCQFQVTFDPPLAMERDQRLFFGILSPGGGSDEVQTWGDVTIANSMSTVGGDPYWTGVYRPVIPNVGAPMSWVPNSTFDPSIAQQTTNGRWRLIIGGFTPSKPKSIFPNAHMWVADRWGDLQAYYLNRACTVDHDMCIASFEGSIETSLGDGPAGTKQGACIDQTVSNDTNTRNLAVTLLQDVGRCYINNLPNNTPTPLVFMEGRFRPYEAFGVTTFLANYGNGLDGVVPNDCGSNTAPITPALTSQTVCTGAQVTLDAAGTIDLDGDPLAYTWTEATGKVPAMDGARAVFIAPPTPTTLNFALAAIDRCELVGRSQVTITVAGDNQAPVVSIAPQGTIRSGSADTLDARASYDPEGDPITFAWIQTSGPTVTLSSATTSQPSFTAPTLASTVDSVTLTFLLTVTDHPTRGGCALPRSSSASIQVIVDRTNHAPTANAGSPQTVNEFATVTLHGSGQDSDGDAVAFAWTQVSGTPVALSNASSPTPSFTAPHQTPTAQETLRFRLVVTDSFGLASSPADVDVTVRDIYAPPDCSQALPSVAMLWPPNHQMVRVAVNNVKESDPEITLAVTAVTVYQDEPTRGLKDGDIPVDATLSTDGSVQVRSERWDKGDGRVYHIGFTANDGYGGVCTGEVKVCAPLSRTNVPACVDGGALYDSTR